jgi:hypothetical protein
MSWKPSADLDREVRRWMKGKGWEVTSTDHDFDREVYAWRHDQRGDSPTLRIGRAGSRGLSGFMVAYHLDTLRVAQAIRAKPTARLAVLQKGTTVVLVESNTADPGL